MLCKVNFHLTPNTSNKYILKLDTENNVLHVSFIGRTVHDIFTSVNAFEEYFVSRKNYKVHINYNSVPKEISNSKKLKRRILRLFRFNDNNIQQTIDAVDDEYNVEKAQFILEHLLNHMNNQVVNNAPDFTRVYDDRVRQKVKNYIEHSLNISIDDDVLTELIKIFPME